MMWIKNQVPTNKIFKSQVLKTYLTLNFKWFDFYFFPKSYFKSFPYKFKILMYNIRVLIHYHIFIQLFTTLLIVSEFTTLQNYRDKI